MPDGGRARHSLYYIYIEEVLSSVLSQGHLLLDISRLVFISSTQFTPIPEAISSIYYIILNHKNINTVVRSRTSLNPSVPIAPIWSSCLKGHTLRISTLGCSRAQNNALHVLSRTALDPAPPKAGLG